MKVFSTFSLVGILFSASYITAVPLDNGKSQLTIDEKTPWEQDESPVAENPLKHDEVAEEEDEGEEKDFDNNQSEVITSTDDQSALKFDFNDLLENELEDPRRRCRKTFKRCRVACLKRKGNKCIKKKRIACRTCRLVKRGRRCTKPTVKQCPFPPRG